MVNLVAMPVSRETMEKTDARISMTIYPDLQDPITVIRHDYL